MADQAEDDEDAILVKCLDTGEMISIKELERRMAQPPKRTEVPRSAPSSSADDSGKGPLKRVSSKAEGLPDPAFCAPPVQAKSSKEGGALSDADIDDILLHKSKRKIFLRQGVPDPWRAGMWKTMTGASAMLTERPNQYEEVLEDVFKGVVPKEVPETTVPTFGGNGLLKEHLLSLDEQLVGVHRLMIAVSNRFPNIGFCPVLPDLLAVFIRYMPEREVYAMAHCMLERAVRDEDYLWTNKTRAGLFVKNFKGVLKKHFSEMSKLLDKLKVDIDSIAILWFNRFFFGSAPYSVVLRLIDCFLNEGNKVMYRVAIGLLKAIEPVVQRAKTPDEFMELMTRAMADVDVNRVIEKGFKVRNLQRKHLIKLGMKNKDTVGQLSLGPDANPMFYRPNIEGVSGIIEIEDFDQIWAWLPEMYRHSDAMLLYNSEVDGYSIATMLDRCECGGPSIMVLKTSKGAVLGAFSSHSYKVSPNYFGDSDTFLYTLKPQRAKFGWKKPSEEYKDSNDYFIQADLKGIKFGGGREGYGLSLDENLVYGNSHRCGTFDNSPLAGEADSAPFQIARLEVFGIG